MSSKEIIELLQQKTLIDEGLLFCHIAITDSDELPYSPWIDRALENLWILSLANDTVHFSQYIRKEKLLKNITSFHVSEIANIEKAEFGSIIFRLQNGTYVRFEVKIGKDNFNLIKNTINKSKA